MKLSDIETGALNAQEWADKGYELPKFDLKAVRAKTHGPAHLDSLRGRQHLPGLPGRPASAGAGRGGSTTGASSWPRALTMRSLTRPTSPMTI